MFFSKARPRGRISTLYRHGGSRAMKILVCGATGFIGSAVSAALRRNGHCVVEGVHRLHGIRNSRDAEMHRDTLLVNFSVPLERSHWVPLLRGFDAVVNAVGIFRETETQDF